MVDEMEQGAQELKGSVSDLNVQLKGVLEKMREPGKLCMDIILMIVLAVVVGILVAAVNYYIKMRAEKLTM